MRLPHLRLAAAFIALAVLPSTARPQDLPLPPFPGDAESDSAGLALDTLTSSLRIVVSLAERRLRVMDGLDTLHTAPIGVGRDTTLAFGDSMWIFATPRGLHVLRRKITQPVWIPPLWHYVEVALLHGWGVAEMPERGAVKLDEGRRLLVRHREVGLVEHGRFVRLPVEDEIVVDGILYVPPLGTRNREVPGELGRYALDIGDGYMLHGTPDVQSVGKRSTHGCVRLLDEDITWLYDNVPVGTPVFIY